jgi:histidyl-tRNA synthetase
MKTDTVKGFRDIENTSKRIVVRNTIEKVFRLYDFIPVETPIIEYEEFVKGENQNDEAISEIFKLKDRGNRELALRYELTFQLKRIAKNKKLPYRRYQIGTVFRDEPIKENRYRQFTQCDVDIVGSKTKDEAEILKIISEILDELKIKFTIQLNNRKLLNEILDELKIKDKDKEFVIREIDKMEKIPEKILKEELKKYNAENILNILKKPEPYFEKYNAYKEIKELKKICKLFGVKFVFTPWLARGLSYYNGTIFEVKGSGIKDTICAGGAYMINGLQSIGTAFGLDRIEVLAKTEDESKKLLIISLDEDKKAIEVCDKIRNLNIPCQIYYGKPGKALDYANSLNIPLVLFIGKEEVKKNKFKIKNMNSGKERFISEKDLENALE